MDENEDIDNDFTLLADVEKTGDEIPSGNAAFMTLLANMNANMCAMNESIKRLNGPSIHGDAEAPPAKKAKLAVTSEAGSTNQAKLAVDSHDRSEPDRESDGGSDGDMLLSNENNEAQHGADVGGPVEDNLLNEIAEALDDTERTDDAIPEKLAEIANKRWHHKLSDDKLKEKREKFSRPVNCEHVIVPRVNPEIWSKLTSAPRGTDLKLAQLQGNLCKVAYITLKSTERLLKSRTDHANLPIDDLVKVNADAIALMGHMSFALAQMRRDNIKPFLHKDYAGLCSPDVPITRFLFGDDLQAELTRIRASNKIGNTTNPRNPQRGNTFRPVSHGHDHGSKQGSFLGRGAQSYRRLGSNQRRPYNSFRQKRRTEQNPPTK
jgi:hypothetical protein